MISAVTLSSVAIFNPRFDNGGKYSDDEPVSFVPMASVSEVSKAIVAEETRLLSEVKAGYTYFEIDDVLIAKITPCFENGKIALASIKNRLGFGTTEFHVVRPNKGKLDSRYLYHFLRRREVLAEGSRKMTGSAGQRRVPRHFFENLSIPLPRTMLAIASSV